VVVSRKASAQASYRNLRFARKTNDLKPPAICDCPDCVQRCCRRATPSIDPKPPSFSPPTSLANPSHTKVDFRYAPRNQQSTICFPDDPRKTVVGQAGELRYGFAKSLSAGMENFGTVIEFSLAGFQDDKILRQWIESPAIPIVHTLIDRPVATFELIAFATGHRGEGRVDNVLLSIKSKSGRVAMVPKIRIRTCERLELESYTVPRRRSGCRVANRPCSSPRRSTTISRVACCGKRRD
jgi:hypothetical protein